MFICIFNTSDESFKDKQNPEISVSFMGRVVLHCSNCITCAITPPQVTQFELLTTKIEEEHFEQEKQQIIAERDQKHRKQLEIVKKKMEQNFVSSQGVCKLHKL